MTCRVTCIRCARPGRFRYRSRCREAVWPICWDGGGVCCDASRTNRPKTPLSTRAHGAQPRIYIPARSPAALPDAASVPLPSRSPCECPCASCTWETPSTRCTSDRPCAWARHSARRTAKTALALGLLLRCTSLGLVSYSRFRYDARLVWACGRVGVFFF